MPVLTAREYGALNAVNPKRDTRDARCSVITATVSRTVPCGGWSLDSRLLQSCGYPRHVVMSDILLGSRQTTRQKAAQTTTSAVVALLYASVAA